jgi:hypothetical protein
MGHWSEELVDETAQMIGGDPDRRLLTELLHQAGSELELLSGRRFHPIRRTTSSFEPNGLPFVDIPNVHVGSMESVSDVFAVPDPITPDRASVLQLASFTAPGPRVAPKADGLWFAGQLIAEVAGSGGLSRDYVLRWLGTKEPNERMEIMRRVMDPAVRFSIPILAVPIGGWWIQISRRLIWVTQETEDEGQLLELLMDNTTAGRASPPLAAVEPVLIAVPLEPQPADWAFAARIWTEGVRRPWTGPGQCSPRPYTATVYRLSRLTESRLLTRSHVRSS